MKGTKRRRRRMGQSPEVWVKEKLSKQIKRAKEELGLDDYILLFKREEETPEGVKFLERPVISVEKFATLFKELIMEGKTSADEFIDYSKEKRLGFEKIFEEWRDVEKILE